MYWFSTTNSASDVSHGANAESLPQKSRCTTFSGPIFCDGRDALYLSLLCDVTGTDRPVFVVSMRLSRPLQGLLEALGDDGASWAGSPLTALQNTENTYYAKLLLVPKATFARGVQQADLYADRASKACTCRLQMAISHPNLVAQCPNSGHHDEVPFRHIAGGCYPKTIWLCREHAAPSLGYRPWIQKLR